MPDDCKNPLKGGKYPTNGKEASDLKSHSEKQPGLRKIIFCGIDANLCTAWDMAIRLESWPLECEIKLQDICSVACGAAVSPANSFGFMNGGVDLAYSRHFGWQVQEKLQNAIMELPFRELLVGQALSVATGDSQIPWLIAAPTMRVPEMISNPEAVFLAARAAMGAAIECGVASLAFPGMGTGTGGLCHGIAARMMVSGCLAALRPPEFPESLRELFDRGHGLY